MAADVSNIEQIRALHEQLQIARKSPPQLDKVIHVQKRNDFMRIKPIGLGLYEVIKVFSLNNYASISWRSQDTAVDERFELATGSLTEVPAEVFHMALRNALRELSAIDPYAA